MTADGPGIPHAQWVFRLTAVLVVGVWVLLGTVGALTPLALVATVLALYVAHRHRWQAVSTTAKASS